MSMRKMALATPLTDDASMTYGSRLVFSTIANGGWTSISVDERRFLATPSHHLARRPQRPSPMTIVS